MLSRFESIYGYFAFQFLNAYNIVYGTFIVTIAYSELASRHLDFRILHNTFQLN